MSKRIIYAVLGISFFALNTVSVLVRNEVASSILFFAALGCLATCCTMALVTLIKNRRK